MFEFVKTIMDNNNLIPAYEEIPQIKEILRLKQPGKEEPGEVYDELKLLEKSGKIKIKLCEGKNFFEFELLVPAMYPQDCARMKVLSHNFDENYYEKFVHRAEKMI